MKRIPGAFCFCAFLSFTVFSQNTVLTISLDKDDIEIPNVALSHFANEISYLPLEITDQCLMGDAIYYRAIRIPELGFVVYKRGQGRESALLFDFNGKFKNVIGRVGKGPGEYIEYRDLVYDKYTNRLNFLTYKGIMVFQLNGLFEKTISVETGTDPYLNLYSMLIQDDHSWAFFYTKKGKTLLNEVGVIRTTKDGKLIKRYDLSDDTSAGTVGMMYHRNHIYLYNEKLYFSHYPGYKTEVLNEDDTWEMAVQLELPIKKVPFEYYESGASSDKIGFFTRENGSLSYTTMVGDYINILGHSPFEFNTFYYIPTGQIFNYTYNLNFRKRGGGIDNDVDGGFPIRVRAWNPEGYMFELVNATAIDDFREKGLLKPDYKRHGEYQQLDQILKKLEPDDNPVLVVVKVKQ